MEPAYTNIGLFHHYNMANSLLHFLFVVIGEFLSPIKPRDEKMNKIKL
jgi:hypothetical protein